MRNKRRPIALVFILLFSQFIVHLVILLNIPVARQSLSFIYFTLFSGFLILKLLMLKELDGIEKILFSVGFGVTFIMIMGLFINEFCLLFGFMQPLSLMPLMVTLNSVIILLWATYIKNGEENFTYFRPRGLNPLIALFMIPFVLSIVGVTWVNAFGNNLILLVMLITISLLFVACFIYNKLTLWNIYPLVVFVIAISLLYHCSLVSNYVHTGDAHMEYFIFQRVKHNAYWSANYPWDVTYGRLNSMLSVTILPTIFSVLLNMDTTWVFKILYPFIFSFVPLGLYKIWQKNIGERIAFASAFFFMVTHVFYTEMLGLNRQMTGELFFVLLLLVVLNKSIHSFKKSLCFFVFSIALIASHYSLALIFFFFMLFSLISLHVLKRSSRSITVAMVLQFFVLMFTWYVYTSRSAIFESFISYGEYVLSQLSNFFDPASREPVVLIGLGLEAPPTVWNAIGRIFVYTTEVFIVVGFVGVLLKRVKIRFEQEYFVSGALSMVLLAALIIVPGLAGTLNMTRFYHILLFFLAPFCVVGAEVIGELIFKKRKAEFATTILLVAVLVPYFLFQSGFVYEMAGVQCWSVPLSKYRMDPSILMCTWAYVNGWKAYGAFWLRDHISVQVTNVYKDWSAHELVSYGMLRYAQYLSNMTKVSSGDVVYLSYLNIVEGMVVTQGGRAFNTTELSFTSDINLVYSNGGCQVYKVPDG